MYKTRYSFTREFLGIDDVRENKLRPELVQTPVAPKPKGPLEPLDARARKLLQNLPAGTSLNQTAQNFPHLVNRLAGVWNEARQLRNFVDDLLVDERGGRAGFPYEILDELITLREARLEYLTGRRSF